MSEMPRKHILISELENYFQDFIDFKRSTGLKYISEGKVLKYFARYCREKYQDDVIPEHAIFEWVHANDNRSQKTKSTSAGIMGEWAKYMFSLGYMQMRIPDIRCPRNTAFVPHIFTASEMESIWRTVDNIQPVRRYPNLHRCIPVLFRLLYSCGPRISEALAITKENIDFDRNIITLRKTKLDKDRWLPMCNSMANSLQKYLEGMPEYKSNDAPICYYRYGETLTAGSVYGRFRMTLQQSGIPYEGKLRGPRLHDFRHTFAVTAMNHLSDEGYDLYVSLPILSAYLGHAGIQSTERYVRLTEDRLSTVTDSIQLNLPNVFPEVKEDEEI